MKKWMKQSYSVFYKLHDRPVKDIMPMSISELGNSSVATVPTLFDLLIRGEIKKSLSKRRCSPVCFGWSRYECQCLHLQILILLDLINYKLHKPMFKRIFFKCGLFIIWLKIYQEDISLYLYALFIPIKKMYEKRFQIKIQKYFRV
jgi:hypothetical protein